MDNNSGQQTVNQPIPPVAPQTEPTNPNMGSEETKQSNRKFIWVVIASISLLVLAGAAFWYLAEMRRGVQVKEELTQEVDQLQNEINSVNIEDEDSGFDTVDEDLDNL